MSTIFESQKLDVIKTEPEMSLLDRKKTVKQTNTLLSKRDTVGLETSD